VRKSKGNWPLLGDGAMLLKWTSEGSEVDYTGNGGIWGSCGGCHESWGSIGGWIFNKKCVGANGSRRQKQRRRRQQQTIT